MEDQVTNIPSKTFRRTSKFSKFIRKYGTPISILIGCIIIAASIYLSFGVQSGGQPEKQAAANPPGTPEQAPAVAGNVAVQTDGLPSLGNSDAPVTLVEFADFQCPFCGRFFDQTFGQIKTNYIDTGKVRFFYNDFAFLGPESESAAAAAKCAQDQNRFWDFHDYLYTHQNGENQGAFSAANLKKFAKDVRLNESDFNSCLDSNKYEQAVRDETNRGKTYGVTGTPTLFINGERVVGALPYETFAQKIEAALQGKK